MDKDNIESEKCPENKNDLVALKAIVAVLDVRGPGYFEFKDLGNEARKLRVKLLERGPLHLLMRDGDGSELHNAMVRLFEVTLPRTLTSKDRVIAALNAALAALEADACRPAAV